MKCVELTNRRETVPKLILCSPKKQNKTKQKHVDNVCNLYNVAQPTKTLLTRALGEDEHVGESEWGKEREREKDHLEMVKKVGWCQYCVVQFNQSAPSPHLYRKGQSSPVVGTGSSFGSRSRSCPAAAVPGNQSVGAAFL
jgi:hypothetical protein